MSDQVIVLQNKDFEIGFWTLPESGEENEAAEAEFQPVAHIHDLSPYGMLLASLGSCTTIVLHTYAQNHNVPLDEVEIHLSYERNFQEDCENCETIESYNERIVQSLVLRGELSEKERMKLSVIANHCSIHKMLEQGIRIETLKHEEEVDQGSHHRHG